MTRGFPGDSVVKNPPANAGDMDSIPGLVRSHMPWSCLSRAPQLLSLCSRAHETQPVSPHAAPTEAQAPRAPGPQREQPQHSEAHVLQLGESPCSNKDLTQSKVNKPLSKMGKNKGQCQGCVFVYETIKRNKEVITIKLWFSNVF